MDSVTSVSPSSSKVDNTKGKANGDHLIADQESETLQKNLNSQKVFGSFRKSKRNSKKFDDPQETNEASSALSQGLRYSKKLFKRQSPIEEPDLSEKKDSFGLKAFRLSKRSPNKHEPGEDLNSPEKKESPGTTGLLVSRIKSSIRAKKKIDFNETVTENRSKFEELQEEDKEENKLLSVMQINELIHNKQLQKAYESIRFMEDKLIEECNNCDFYENVTEFTIRGRDVDLLYKSLFNVIRSIVKESLDQEHIEESTIVAVVRVIDKEASTRKNPDLKVTSPEISHLGQPKRWKELWKEAVRSSVAHRVQSVPLDPSLKTWLSDYLESLKTNTVKDLMKVKNSLKSLYPEDYNVYNTYVCSFHDALSSHLQQDVIPLAEEFSQLYCLLNWIMNIYTSDDFMGNPELQPEMNPFGLSPLLHGECLGNVKREYHTALQKTIKMCFNNLLEMEKKKWEEGEEPEEDMLQDSGLPIYIDIEEMIGGHVRQSARLSEELETSSYQACVEELGTFATRLQAAFQEWSGTTFSALFVQYTVVYIISLMKLRHNTTQSDAEQSTKAETSLNEAIEKLKKHLLHLFKMDTKSHFQSLITKKWLQKNTAFNAIMKSTDVLCKYLKYLISPHDKEFAGEVHKYVVKEYISQIMKRKMSLTHSKRKKAAEKMREEGDLINRAAEEMGSDKESLSDTIHCISEIIASKKKDEIKPQLERIIQLHPDVSSEHILCIFHLRGTRRNSQLLEHFEKFQDSHQSPEGPTEKLFAEIKCSPQVPCLGLCLR